MNKTIVVLAALIFIAAKPELKVEKIKGFDHPQAVCLVSGNLYVADIGKQLKPLAKDGDGAIAVVGEKGEVIYRNAVSASGKIDAPKGITSFNYKGQSGGFSMVRKAIAVTDIDKVYAYELIFNSRVFYMDLSKESSSLAGIVALNDSILFVAATDKNCIFKININTKGYTKVSLPMGRKRSAQRGDMEDQYTKFQSREIRR